MIQTGTIAANAHIENLQQQLEQTGSQKLDYLVLAHPDQLMINQLNKALHSSSVAVIGLPQNCWSMGSESMNELVTWALTETSAKGILLVGHSQGGTPDEAVQVCESGKTAPAGSEPTNGAGTTMSNQAESILERVKNAQAASKKNEQHFVAELNELKGQISLHNGRVTNPDLVKGLFYRAESGVFCSYDDRECQFEALINESLIG